ncbi:MAG: adenylate kinase family protein [Thermoproteota archaeon]
MDGKVIVVTGTPGTGKSSLCRRIVRRNPGWVHLDLGRFAFKMNSIIRYDPFLKTHIVDTGNLRRELRKYILKSIRNDVRLLIDGHYSAEVSPAKYVDFCVVLRCRPDVLWRRLKRLRKYPAEKLLGNIESELTDYCYLMAKQHLRGKRIIQIDTTEKSVEEIYEVFMECYRKGFRYKGDVVDWISFFSEHLGKMGFLFRQH